MASARDKKTDAMRMEIHAAKLKKKEERARARRLVEDDLAVRLPFALVSGQTKNRRVYPVPDCQAAHLVIRSRDPVNPDARPGSILGGNVNAAARLANDTARHAIIRAVQKRRASIRAYAESGPAAAIPCVTARE